MEGDALDRRREASPVGLDGVRGGKALARVATAMSTGAGSVAIEAASGPTDEIRSLIAELDRTLCAVYKPEQRHGLALDAIFQPHMRFYVARLGAMAVGCGGVALFANFAEVKRMYVREDARGRGVARAVLARLEGEAEAAGLVWLRLETGDQQVAALRLYEGAGFQRCPAFGVYATMPPSSIVTSVFMEKRVGAVRRRLR